MLLLEVRRYRESCPTSYTSANSRPAATPIGWTMETCPPRSSSYCSLYKRKGQNCKSSESILYSSDPPAPHYCCCSRSDVSSRNSPNSHNPRIYSYQVYIGLNLRISINNFTADTSIYLEVQFLSPDLRLFTTPDLVYDTCFCDPPNLYYRCLDCLTSTTCLRQWISRR